MRRTFVAVALAVLLMAGQTYAAGGGGGGGMGGTGGGHGGGADVDSHASQQGLQNSNGPMAVDRDKGPARAEDRMSREGSTHTKATAHKHKKS